MPLRRKRQAGFTYLGLMFAVAIMGLFLTLAARVWTLTEQREREMQLLFAGDAIRMAIARYYAFGHQYPLSLQSLVADDRFPNARRYLRRIYTDPITGQADWTLIPSSDGVGIMGVASRSKGSPLKRAGFSWIDQSFEHSDCYCTWQFIYVPRNGYGNPGALLPNAAPPKPGS